MVKITDFGIARIAATSQTQAGVIKGTPYYMSPEQINPKILKPLVTIIDKALEKDREKNVISGYHRWHQISEKSARKFILYIHHT